MGDIAVSVRKVGKRYKLGARQQGYRTLRDALVTLASAPKRWLGKAKDDSASDFWALRDVSFDVRKGDVVGVIGRNGAGKSTLLKILSNITDPTEGEALIYGRLSSLLEVGTGFHPELTGRENIYLNGAILGMPRDEIARRFDEIVSFAEIEKFLDTPAKRYSSGMYMRLAFSVAAHMSPDILVIDEVLAVGDADFQKKCLGKMEQVSKEGRTVLFVSHSMPTVLRLCRQAVLLDHGQTMLLGNTRDVVAAYLQVGSGRMAERVWSPPVGNEHARLQSIRVLNRQGEVADTLDIREPVSFEVTFWNDSPQLRPTVNLHFYNDEGTCLFVVNDFTSPRWIAGPRGSGLVTSVCKIPGNFFSEGRVIVRHTALVSHNPTHVHAHELDTVSFQVVDQSDGDGARGPYGGDIPGAIRPMFDWDLVDGPPPTSEVRS